MLYSLKQPFYYFKVYIDIKKGTKLIIIIITILFAIIILFQKYFYVTHIHINAKYIKRARVMMMMNYVAIHVLIESISKYRKEREWVRTQKYIKTEEKARAKRKWMIKPLFHIYIFFILIYFFFFLNSFIHFAFR